MTLEGSRPNAKRPKGSTLLEYSTILTSKIPAALDRLAELVTGDKLLGIVYRTLATHLIQKADYKKSQARTGAVTLFQRFGGALNLNIHFHMLFLDGIQKDRAVSERKKLKRICRYISRPAVFEKRLSLTRQGKVRYELKTPYRDGTTHVIFEPVDFIASLAALVPRPRVNLTRYH